MKLNDRFLNNLNLPFGVRICACGDLVHPGRPIRMNAPIIEDPLYSPKGFIKGISILDKVKNLRYGFSTVEFGNMGFKYGERDEVTQNRKNFTKAVGINLKNAAFMQPNHGRAIEIVTSADRGKGAFTPGSGAGPADAIITTEKNVALGLNSADCVPVIITSKNSDILALVHAGRLGTDSKITRATVKKLVSLGVSPKDLVAGIGPSAQKACYKLKYLDTSKPGQWLPWVSAAAKNVKVSVKRLETGKYRIEAERGKILVDIIGFNVKQLIDAGLQPENIDVTPLCSICFARRGKLYSHYLSSQYKASNLYPEGRFMAIAMLK